MFIFQGIINKLGIRRLLNMNIVIFVFFVKKVAVQIFLEKINENVFIKSESINHFQWNIQSEKFIWGQQGYMWHDFNVFTV